MAYSVNWGNKVINIPRADLQLTQETPTEIRQLDLMVFRSNARLLSASGDGMPFDEIINHVAPISVGSVTLARVVEVINDWTVTFEDGQYSVNLVGANTNLHERTNRNQVSVWPNNSAGLTYSRQIEDQSYEGGKVFIDIDRGLPGYGYPRGTPSDPVDNMLDALIIAGLRKFYKFALEGTLVFNGTEPISDTDWYGNTRIQSRLELAGNTVTDCVFSLLDFRGSMVGTCTIKDSRVEDISGFRGTIINSHLAGTIVLAVADENTTVVLEKCVDASASGTIPVLDCNGTLANIVIQGYHGGLIIRNHTDGGYIDVDVDAGELLIESSCNSGTITIRGQCKVTDNSSIGCTVINQAGTLQAAEFKRLMFRRRNTIVNGRVSVIRAGDDADGVVVDVIRDATGVPTEERPR